MPIYIGNNLVAGIGAPDESLNILDFIHSEEREAIRAGTSVFDCHAAIMAAINSATYGSSWYIEGPSIYFPSGKYNSSQNIELKKRVRLHGAGSGMSGGSQATIKFPAGVNGITVNRYNTLNGTTEGVPSTSADGSLIEGLVIQGGGKASGGSNFGLWLRARAVIRNVRVEAFSGTGILIVATAGAGGAAEGNANCFMLDTGSVYGCGGDGIFVDGADSNAGNVNAFDCSSNGGWGIYDSSFLGNTYAGCHTADNTSGAYKTDNANARNIFVGCYSEGGQPASDIAFPSQCIGGLHGAGFTDASFNGVVTGGSIFSQLYGTDLHEVSVNGNRANGDIVLAQKSGTNSTSAFRLKYAGKDAVLNVDNLDANNAIRITGSGTSIAGGRSGGQVGRAVLLDPLLGDGSTNSRVVTYRSAAPTTGEWARGDVVFNNAPSASGFVGWTCVTGGTPGTWKTFGAISA